MFVRSASAVLAAGQFAKVGFSMVRRARSDGAKEDAESFGATPLPTVKFRDESCAPTRSSRNEKATRDEFASWISTNSVELGSDLSENACHAAMIPEESQLATGRYAE